MWTKNKTRQTKGGLNNHLVGRKNFKRYNNLEFRHNTLFNLIEKNSKIDIKN
jgi:hypothetical protein